MHPMCNSLAQEKIVAFDENKHRYKQNQLVYSGYPTSVLHFSNIKFKKNEKE